MSPLALQSVLPFLFRADWSDTVTVETAYDTNIVRAPASMAEERLGLNGRPSRTVTASVAAYDRDEMRDLQFGLQRISSQTNSWPLYPDVTEVSATSSGALLWCTPEFRRFYPGQRITIVEVDGYSVTNIEYATVQDGVGSVLADRLLLKSNLSKTYEASPHTLVFPMIDVGISSSQRMQFLTDYIARVPFKLRELYGFSAMPSSNPDGDTSGFSTFNGYPVFDLPVNWTNNVSGRVVREGRKARIGRGEYFFGEGDKARWYLDLELLRVSREEFWQLLNFFDYSKGRLRPILLPNPGTSLIPTEVDPDYIQIEKLGNFEDYQEFLTYLAIRGVDGSLTIREFSSIQDTGINPSVPVNRWRINFDQTVPGLSASDVFEVTAAHLVRFQKDSMRELWSTPSIVTVKAAFTELIEEEIVTISNINPAFPV